MPRLASERRLEHTGERAGALQPLAGAVNPLFRRPAGSKVGPRAGEVGGKQPPQRLADILAWADPVLHAPVSLAAYAATPVPTGQATPVPPSPQ